MVLEYPAVPEDEKEADVTGRDYLRPWPGLSRSRPRDVSFFFMTYKPAGTCEQQEQPTTNSWTKHKFYKNVYRSRTLDDKNNPRPDKTGRV